jgi:DNA-binding transcriptional regulator GbsR (MarR family)
MNEVIEDPVLYELYTMALDLYKKPNDTFYEGRYSGAVAIALHVVPHGKIYEIELKAKREVDGERQEEDEDQKVTDKAEKIKKLTAEFVKKHEELNSLAEMIKELETE